MWLNSKHEKSDNKPQISLGNASAESVAGVATLTKDTKFSYHDVVKIVRGNFIGFHTIVTEASDTNNEWTWWVRSKLFQGALWEIGC